MTRPNAFSEPSPAVEATPALRTSPGEATIVDVTITNRAAEPRVFAVSTVGVDATWLPMPSQSAPVPPGESVAAQLTLRPAHGTLPARYPMSVLVQALEPASGQPRSAVTVNEVDLIVGAPGQISVALDPPDTTAIYSKKFFIVLQNSGAQPESVHLEARSPYSTAVDVSRGPFLVAPGSTMRVPGRLTVTRPTLFRRRIRHAYSVTARTAGAPRYAEGSLTARAVIGPMGAKVIGVLAVLAMWVAIALIFVPRLADSIHKPNNQAGGTTTVKVKTGGAKKSGKAGGSGGGTGGGAGTSGSGGAGGGAGGAGGGGGAGTAGASSKSATIQLNGTVSGSSPAGVLVSLSPTTFGAQGPAGDSSVGAQNAQDTPIGKLTPDALSPSPLLPQANSVTSDRSVSTGADGAWSFANVATVGFYTLSFTKPGYETQRFIIDPTSAAAAEPMKVSLAPGTGSLHGVVHNAAGGNVGAATITISDGTNTLTTSTVSKGNGIGSWSITGLSTPSSYTVTASHDGLGVASRLVSLAASGDSAVDLTMSSGVATLTGFVHTVVNGHDGGVGGVQVSATDGTVTRTASTVTTGSQQGRFTLPDLSVGKWIVSLTAPGYQLQSRPVLIVAGKSFAQLRVTLSPSTVTVPGFVYAGSGADKPLPGAGLILSNTTNTYKQTSIKGGRFGFADVAPGTYTLTAQYFGYDTSYQTVVAVVGKQPHPSTFHLGTHTTTNTSSVAGYIGNAVASGGSLGCIRKNPLDPTSAPIVGCDVYFALADSDGVPIPATLGKDDNTVQPHETASLDGPNSYILALNPKQGDGLKPGRYKLTISSPGYLPASIAVQVPLNGVASAPQIGLFPANAIAGKIDTIGAINGDGLLTNVKGDNCVVAVPLGYSSDNFDVTKFVCDQAKATAPGAIGPGAIPPLTKLCQNTGVAEPAFGIIENDGRYKVPALCDGQYNVHIVMGNTAYDADSQVITTQAVSRGQTLEYSPHLARKPVVQIHVGRLNTDTGLTVPVSDNTTVTVRCVTAGTPASTVTSTVQTENDLATLWGVKAGDADCSATLGAITASTGTVSVADDHTYPATATTVSSLPAVFGRIVSRFGSSDANAVGGLVLTVRGVVSYLGSTPTYGTAHVTTNAAGCYAITVDGSVPATGPSGCGTFTKVTTGGVGPSVGALTLTSRAVTVQAPVGTAITTSLTTTSTTMASLAQIDPTHPVPSVSVTAAPVPLNGLKLSTDPTGLNLLGATLTPADNSATSMGAGTITAGINSAGQLTWTDSNIGTSGYVWQGSYHFDVKVPGFSPNLISTLTCGMFDDDPADTIPASFHCSLTPATIDSYGELRGRVTAPNLTPPLHTPLVAVSPATVIARLCPVDPTSHLAVCPTVDPSDAAVCNPLVTDYTATTDSDGKYDFVSPGGVRYMTRGTYVLITCAAGTITDVTSGVSANLLAGGVAPQHDVVLDLLGGVSGVVTASNNSLGLNGVKVQLYSCPTAACSSLIDQLTTTGSGNYQFSGTTGRYFLTAGDYKLSFDATALGYTMQSTTFTITSRDAPTADTTIILQALGALGGTVTETDSSPVAPIPTTTLTLRSCTSDDPTTCTSVVKVTGTDGGGNYQFTGATSKYFLTPGKYQVKASAAGYSPYTSGVLDIAGGDNPTLGAVTMARLGSLAGKVVDNTVDAAGVGGASVGLKFCGALVTDCPAASTTPVPTPQFSAVTDPGGNYQFVSLGNAYLFTPGYWQMRITANGFVSAVDNVLLHTGDNPTPSGQGALVALGSLSGTISGVGTSTQALSGAHVVADECPAGYDPLTPDPTTCTGIDSKSTSTDPFGKYTFAGTGTPWALDPSRYWRVTASAFGYADNSAVFLVNSGPNTGKNVTEDILKVTQPIKVQIASLPSPRYTGHALVTLTRNDAPTTSIPTTFAGGDKTYTADPLYPGAYTVKIESDGQPLGQNIQQSTFGLNVPLVDAAHQTQVAVSYAPFILSDSLVGSVLGKTGDTTTTSLANIPVELFPVGDSVHHAEDLGGDPMFTKTLAGGTFSLDGIPNGTYDVHINDVDSSVPTLAAVNPSYAALTVPAVVVTYGVIQDVHAQSLDPTTQTVKVTMSLDSGEDVSGGTGTLTPSDGASWIARTDAAPTGSGANRVFTFTGVPRGCWAFTLPFSSGSPHHGGVSTTDDSAGCPISIPASRTSTTKNASYSFDEHILTLSPSVVPNTTPDSAGTASFTLTVTGPGPATVYQDTNVTSSTVSKLLYLAEATYTVHLTLNSGVSPIMWPSAASWSSTFALTGPVTKSPTATEAALSTVVVRHHLGTAASPVSVQLTCSDSQDLPTGCASPLPALAQSDDNSGNLTFSALAPGHWKVTITGGSLGATTKSQTLNVAAGGTATTKNADYS